MTAVEKTAPTHRASKELRLAVVCYGGVSLAIYMHGQTSEINRLVKASALLDEGHDPSGSSPSEQAYATVLERLADDHPDGVRTRVVVDVISGTSAGGINGVCLAKALAHNLSQHGLRDLWLEKGDIGLLVRGWRRLPWKLRLAVALPQLRRRPALRGDEMAGWIYSALEQMDDDSSDPPKLESLVPARNELELFVTVTDFYGYPREILLPERDPDDEEETRLVYETRHGHALEFRRAGRRDDFQRKDNVALALAARATSSFPGAFPPISFDTFEGYLRKSQIKADLRDPDAEKSYFRIYGLSRGSARQTYFIDGGVLDNHPFGHAIDAIKQRAAWTEVDRRLLYLEPDPGGRPSVPDASSEPTPIATVFGAVSSIPRKEPLLDELLDISTRNERVRRVREVIEVSFDRIRERVEELVGADFLGRPPDVESERLVLCAQAIAEAARVDAGFGYAPYLRMKIVDVVDNYARGICAVTNFPPDCNQALFVRTALRAWAKRKGLFDKEEGPTAAQVDFLKKFDIDYLERRIGFVIDGVNWHYRDHAHRHDPPLRADLDTVKRRLYDAIDELRSARADAATEQTVSETIERSFSESALWAYSDREGFKPIAFARAHEQDLDMLRDELDKHLTARLSGFAARLYSDVYALTGNWPLKDRRDLLVRYLGFPFWDILLYPIRSLADVGERDHIEVIRMSPREASLLSDEGEKKLAGVGHAHYGAFFTRPGRERDYLWGRLDAAERLLELLLGRGHPDFEALCRRAFEAILEEEREALTEARDLIDQLAGRVEGLRREIATTPGVESAEYSVALDR